MSKRKRKRIKQGEWIIIILLAIMILMLAFVGWKSGAFQSILAGGFFLPFTDIEQETEECGEFHIYNEYVSTFGQTNIDTMRTACQSLYASGYHAYANELGCYIDGVANFTCPSSTNWNAAPQSWKTFVDVFRTKCEAMNAVFVCRNDYFGCLCNKNPPSQWEPPYQAPEGDGQDGRTECSSIFIPTDIGDKGSYCRDYGYCDYEQYSCEHYWDWNAKIHKCACSETYFCGQYCYVYSYTSQCECPPSSVQILTSRSTYYCVPSGCECNFNGADTTAVGTRGDVECWGP